MQIIDQNNGDDVARSGTHKRSDKIGANCVFRALGSSLTLPVRVGEAQKLQQDQQQLIGDRKTGQPIDERGRRDTSALLVATQAKDIAKQLQYRLKTGLPGREARTRVLIDADAFAPAIFRKFETEAALPIPASPTTNDATITLAGIFQVQARARKTGRFGRSGLIAFHSGNTPLEGHAKSPQFEYFNGYRSPRIACTPSDSTSTNCLACRSLFVTRMLPASASCSIRFARCTFAPAHHRSG